MPKLARLDPMILPRQRRRRKRRLLAQASVPGLRVLTLTTWMPTVPSLLDRARRLPPQSVDRRLGHSL